MVGFCVCPTGDFGYLGRVHMFVPNFLHDVTLVLGRKGFLLLCSRDESSVRLFRCVFHGIKEHGGLGTRHLPVCSAFPKDVTNKVELSTLTEATNFFWLLFNSQCWVWFFSFSLFSSIAKLLFGLV
jgi:hypothetical protein